MTTEKWNFRISSALKDVIGRDLITNEFVAVFELVKNSFDAHAKKVDVAFHLEDEINTIVISDNGKGMSRDDLYDKWLFVAYSAKKEGTEDYRDKIRSSRIHAGAKGIGRFSCDRLGKGVNIYSKKKGEGIVNKISVKWEDFELDATEEFANVDIQYEQLTKHKLIKSKSGTAIEIVDLRDEWDRNKLLKLKRSLEKLINPNQENDADNFAISINAASCMEEDKKFTKEEDQWKIVNGPVKNFLFETIGLKTTSIVVKVSEDGKTIRSILEDRGQRIFEILEANPYSYGENLHNIEVHLFVLGRVAKAHFTRYMGTQPVNYGSVFVYKNGFRISPIGDHGHDAFNIDSRKTQGTSRFLGTRDLLGRIEINGDNSMFYEASSRDGGLVKNEAYGCLENFFIEHCLKRIEKYAVNIVKYGNLGESFEEALETGDTRSKIFSLVQTLTNSKEIIDIKYDPDVVDIFSELSEKSLLSILSNFRRIASNSEASSVELDRESSKIEKRLKDLTKAKEEAEAEAERANREKEEAEKKAKEDLERARLAEAKAAELDEQAEAKTTENIFLRSMVSQDVTNIVSLHHHIGISAQTIENYINNMSERIKKGEPYSEDTVLKFMRDISLQARKILSTTRFATKANFNLEGAKVEKDICEYIKEYLMNVCQGVIKTTKKTDLQFEFINSNSISFEMKFRPLEIAIILDNLISNSVRANAKKFIVEMESVENKFIWFNVIDDGDGFKKGVEADIFEFGVTTTSGSGLGLFQTKELIENMKGTIGLGKDKRTSGAFFKVSLGR